MAQIAIPDDVYAGLTRAAAARGVSVEEVALPALAALARESEESPDRLTPEERARRIHETAAHLRAILGERTGGRPIDDSRESIYEGCGE